MQLYLNEGYIKRRASVGKWASLLGLVVLAGGFLISLRNPALFFVSFATLIVGFLLSNVGIYYANRYVRAERPDAVLAQALKGLDRRFALYQFLLPVSHLLREPGGLTVFVVKPQEGTILYQEGKWRNKQGWGRLLRWVGQEGLGRPEQELEQEVQAMEEWLHKQDSELEVPVRGLVVFTHPNVDLQVGNTPIPALLPKQIKGWLRKSDKLSPLPDETFEQLKQLLNEGAGVSDEQSDA
jgi:hypothetical protein